MRINWLYLTDLLSIFQNYLPLLFIMNSVNLQEEYAKTEIAKLLNLLDEELVGLAPVKSRIREIAALLLIEGSYINDILAPLVKWNY